MIDKYKRNRMWGFIILQKFNWLLERARKYSSVYCIHDWKKFLRTRIIFLFSLWCHQANSHKDWKLLAAFMSNSLQEGSFINAWGPKKSYRKCWSLYFIKAQGASWKPCPRKVLQSHWKGSAFQKGWMCCKNYTIDNASVHIFKKVSWTTTNEIKLVRKLQ